MSDTQKNTIEEAVERVTLVPGTIKFHMLCLYQPFIILWQHNSNVYGFSLPALLVVLFVVWISRRMIHTYKDAAGLWEIDKYRPVTEVIVNLCLNLLMDKMLGLEGIVLSTIIYVVCWDALGNKMLYW